MKVKMIVAMLLMAAFVGPLMAASVVDVGAYGSGMLPLYGQGKAFYVDGVSGSDSNTGLKPRTALKTMTKALEKCTTNKNDTIFVLSGASALTSTCTINVDKSYIHIVGVAAECGIAGRARMWTTAASTITPVMSVTGTGCSVRNISMQNSTHGSEGLGVLYVTGDRCYFENLHLYGITNANQDAAGAYCLQLNGGTENLFRHCFIGGDGVDAGSAANSEILFDTDSSRDIFEDCVIYRRIEHDTNHALVRMNDGTGMGAWTLFKNCTFIYSSTNEAYHGTTVFVIPAISSKSRKFIIQNCMAVSGSTAAIAWDSSSRGITCTDMPTTAATAGGGLGTFK